MLCPLCQSEDLRPVRHAQVRGEIFRCQKCDLIFKSAADFPDWEKQKHRYDQHSNHIENPGYVEFFQQLLKPLEPFLSKDMEILDWGSGPGEQPVLSELLRREGYSVDLYDPLYQPHIPKPVYDVIISTEVIEHFQTPDSSFHQILSLLPREGIFAGLTNFHQGEEKFQNWWYVKDPTHVVFYSEKTFEWIAEQWNLEVFMLQNPVFIFRKL